MGASSSGHRPDGPGGRRPVRFTEYTLDPVSDAVRDAHLLGSTLPEDVTILREDGSDALQRLRDDQVGETLTEAAYTISGRTVTVTFEDAGAVARFYMPASVDFEAGDRQLRVDVPMEAVDMEATSSDSRGITRADAPLPIRLREIG